MRTSQRAAATALAVAGWLTIGHAQRTIGPPAPEVLLSTQFRTPLPDDAALARLNDYYDDQVGRKSAAAFPRIAGELTKIEERCYWFDGKSFEEL